MSVRLSDVAYGRGNNFNLIRFLGAVLVIVTHSSALSSETTEGVKFIGMSLGDIGVDVFFVTSGFLVAKSFFSGKNWLEFAWARVLRIYPALLMAIVFCVLLGAYFTALGIPDYFFNRQTWRYVLVNGVMLFGEQAHLPGVFVATPFGGWVNGSLWTLPHELRLYVLLGGFGALFMAMGQVLGRSVARCGLLALACILLVVVTVNYEHVIVPDDHVRAYRLFSMFFVGVAAYLWRDRIRLSTVVAAIILFCLSFMSVYFGDKARPFYGLALPYLVLYFAYVPAGALLQFNRLGDYSYGLYIYHWPLMQALVSLHPGIGMWQMLLMGFGLALLAAVLSWHMLEKKCLSLKKRFRSKDADEVKRNKAADKEVKGRTA